MMSRRQRILISDFGGYPFTVQLAKELARLDHEVIHSYCDSLVTTPRGVVESDVRKGDGGIEIKPIRLRQPLDKYSFRKRWLQEREYGRRAANLIEEVSPSVVLTANTPLDALGPMQRAARKVDAKSIFWLQDIIGVAMHRILSKKIPVLGKGIGNYYLQKEKYFLHKADHVVCISPDFVDLLERWAIDRNKVTVIENWGPLEDIPRLDRRNSWSRARGLDEKFVFLYSGTLSMKHTPSTLSTLAEHIADRNGVVVVRSQGMGASWLQRVKEERKIDNLIVEPFGPYQETAAAFASSDALVALLDDEASDYSVPSKVLAYLCAGRPLLLNVPLRNKASQVVLQEGAGLVVEPGLVDLFLQQADRLMADAGLRREMGERARSYAENTFRIDRIAARFEQLILSIA